MGNWKVAVLFGCLAFLSTSTAAYLTGSKLGPPLKLNFYKESCPKFEKIVEDTLAYYYSQDPTTPAPLLRLFFHDCFVQGCDSSVLLNSTTNNTAEKDAPINFSIGDFYVLDDIKGQLEEECPETVSCADVVALTAVYSVKQAGGLLYEIELGRRDALTSYAPSSETFLPAFSLNVSGLVDDFEYIGLNLKDVITLSGAHTIGQAHCNSITNRIYPKIDPVYPPSYGKELRANCTDDGAIKPPSFDPNVQFFNDPITPLIFDNQYFKNLEAGLGLFTSDYSLYKDPRTRKLVKKYAEDQAYFFEEFGKALRKMGRNNVLTGTQGQIRKQCWVTNSNNADPAFDPISYDFTDF
jgi:peroxidase